MFNLLNDLGEIELKEKLYGRIRFRRLFRWNTRTTTMSQNRIDIRWMKKQNYLDPGRLGALSWSSRDKETGSIRFQMGKDRMVLEYRHRTSGGDWEDVK